MSEGRHSFRAALTTTGRKSGRPHTVWLKAVMYEGRVYFSRHRPDSDWFQNAVHNPHVVVEFDNRRYFGIARSVKDEQLARRISEIKYPGEERAKEKRVVIEVTLEN